MFGYLLGFYYETVQRAFLGDPGAVTRDMLGHLGGDPHFEPPKPLAKPGQVFYGRMYTKEDWDRYHQLKDDPKDGWVK